MRAADIRSWFPLAQVQRKLRERGHHDVTIVKVFVYERLTTVPGYTVQLSDGRHYAETMISTAELSQAYDQDQLLKVLGRELGERFWQVYLTLSPWRDPRWLGRMSERLAQNLRLLGVPDWQTASLYVAVPTGYGGLWWSLSYGANGYICTASSVEDFDKNPDQEIDHVFRRLMDEVLSSGDGSRRRPAAAPATRHETTKFEVLATLETFLIEQARVTGVSDQLEHDFAKLQRLKAVALQPGTPAEGQAAYKMAMLALVKMVL